MESPKSPNSALEGREQKIRRKGVSREEAAATPNEVGQEESRESVEAGKWKEAGERFTKRAVNGLVAAAYSAARGEEGSGKIAGLSHSQLRLFHQALHEDIMSWEESLEAKPTVGKLQEVICTILKTTEDSDPNRCRPQSTSGNRNVFPLPVSVGSDGFDVSPAVLQSVARCLNSLNGTSSEDTGRPSAGSVRAMKRLGEALAQSPILDEILPDDCFQNFFLHKKLDYMGEEVRVAKKLVWKALEPALPSEVGQLFLRDYCTGGVLDYVDRFEEFLVDPKDQVIGKTPRVMVDPGEWKAVAKGLLDKGLCKVIAKKDVYHISNLPLLNGMFAVGKQEFLEDSGLEICRLIMNLKPTNLNCRTITADTGTLPSINHLSTLVLEPDSVLLSSSEDIKCFFYLFRVPEAWMRFLAFGLALPDELVPLELRSEDAFLTATVLPMGWLNSVGLAQHIHRNIVRQALGNMSIPIGGESELRRDKVFSSAPHLFRVYLDNFDELRKVDRKTAALIEGTPSEVAHSLRAAYEEARLPRHPKKSVQQKLRADIQGALVDGETGIMCARPSKIARYVALALELIKRGKASQRELQVVGGGFVYIAMFKRPLMSGLNVIWRKIIALEGSPTPKRVLLEKSLVGELARFIGLIPLAYSSFRSPFDHQVSASDASNSGGGVCISRGLTPYGAAAATGWVRGDLPENHDFCQVLCIGLFDGISGLRVALDCLGAPVAGHISIEKQGEARRVVESYFADTIFVEDVELVDLPMVESWALRFSSVGLVLLGGGPPCQGVSGLNADRRGALRDHRSSLFHHVSRVKGICKQVFKWAQVMGLTENVASMDAQDCQVMNDSFETQPWFINTTSISLAARPRLYWTDWELLPGPGVELVVPREHKLPGWHQGIPATWVDDAWRQKPSNFHYESAEQGTYA